MKDRPDLDGWFAGLRNGQSTMCCSFDDAEALADVQWDLACDEQHPRVCHYKVFLDNRWIDVPDYAVVNTPNKYGQAVVWPLRYPAPDGKVYGIRCFIPGWET